MRHGTEQFLLRINIEIFENVRSQCMRQDAKDDDLFVFRQIENYLGDIGWRPFAKDFSQRGEVTRVDHAPDFGF